MYQLFSRVRGGQQALLLHWSEYIEFLPYCLGTFLGGVHWNTALWTSNTVMRATCSHKLVGGVCPFPEITCVNVFLR